jgi:hypothetical protein
MTSSETEFWIQIGGATFLISGLIFVLIHARAKRKRDQADAEEQRQALERAIAEGAVPPGKCVVCKERDANEFFPYIGRSRIEGAIPLRDLYSLPPMYVRRDYADGGPMLCRTHKHMIDLRIDTVLAGIRARMAGVYTDVSVEVATLEGGILLEWARAMDREAGEKLNVAMRANEVLPLTLPPVSSMTAPRALVLHTPDRADEENS